MIKGENKIYTELSNLRPMLINYAKKKLPYPYFNDIDVDIIVDDVILYTLKSEKTKTGFNDFLHLKRHVFYRLVKSIRISFFARRKKMEKELGKLPKHIMDFNYVLARDIINRARANSVS